MIDNKTKKKIFKALGKRIKNQRKKINMTIEELSEKTKIREVYLLKIEKGEAFGLSTTKFIKIAEALQVKPYELVEGIKC